MAQKAKEKLLYAEKYDKPGRVLMACDLPTFPAAASVGMVVKRAEVWESGRVDKDGEEFEYHLVRVLMQPGDTKAPK